MTRASPKERGYGEAWRRAALGHLRNHPLCVMCAARGDRVRAEHVDHKIKHNGDQRLFWDKSNWQSLCAPHHNSAKQKQELHGYHGEVGPDGLPTDPNHPWLRASER